VTTHEGLGAPALIAGAEKLARFIFRREHVRATGEVKQDAFHPAPAH